MDLVVLNTVPKKEAHTDGTTDHKMSTEKKNCVRTIVQPILFLGVADLSDSDGL